MSETLGEFIKRMSFGQDTREAARFVDYHDLGDVELDPEPVVRFGWSRVIVLALILLIGLGFCCAIIDQQMFEKAWGDSSSAGSIVVSPGDTLWMQLLTSPRASAVHVVEVRWWEKDDDRGWILWRDLSEEP